MYNHPNKIEKILANILTDEYKINKSHIVIDQAKYKMSFNIQHYDPILS